MPRPKSHLFVTPVPIRSGETLQAECGAPIANALATYCGEDAATVAVTCSRCQKLVVANSGACLCMCDRCMPRDQERVNGGLHCGGSGCSRAEQVRLFYALVNGQEAKLEGNE
jgi:hypothetical protein